VGAEIRAAMAGINHDDAIAKGQRWPEQQRLNVFLQINAMNENLVVNEFRGETELNFRAVPGRVAAADFQNHRAVRRTHRIRGHGRIGQPMRRADFVFGGPAIERSPRRHRRGVRCIGPGGWRHRPDRPWGGEFF